MLRFHWLRADEDMQGRLDSRPEVFLELSTAGMFLTAKHAGPLHMQWMSSRAS